MIEGHADTPPAQKRVGFLDREIGERLVATDIQGAHGHGGRVQGLQLFPIQLALLLLAGKPVTQQKTDFGAIQPDTLRTKLAGALHIGGNPRVDPQRHSVAVRGGRRLLGQRRQLLKERLILGQQALESRQQIRVGIHVDPAVVAIDNQLTIGQLLERQILHAHDGGNTHRPRQDGGMAVGAAAHRHDADQLFARNLS